MADRDKLNLGLTVRVKKRRGWVRNFVGVVLESCLYMKECLNVKETETLNVN